MFLDPPPRRDPSADVGGYSRLMATDEEGTHERLKAHLRELVDPKIKEHRGRIVKNSGDGMLAKFASVEDALRCATEVQAAGRSAMPRRCGLPYRVPHRPSPGRRGHRGRRYLRGRCKRRGAAAFFVSRVAASLARGEPASVRISLSNSSRAQRIGQRNAQPAEEQRRVWWEEIPALLCRRGLDPLGERQTQGRSYPRPVSETSVRVAVRLISPFRRLDQELTPGGAWWVGIIPGDLAREGPSPCISA